MLQRGTLLPEPTHVLWERRLKRGESCCTTLLGERSEKWKRSSPAGTQVSEEEGLEALETRSRSSLQPRRGPWRIRLSLYSSWALCGADLPMQSLRRPHQIISGRIASSGKDPLGAKNDHDEAVDMKRYRLTGYPIPHSHVPLMGEDRIE